MNDGASWRVIVSFAVVLNKEYDTLVQLTGARGPYVRIEYDFNFALRTTRGYMRTSLTPSLSPSLAFTWKDRYGDCQVQSVAIRRNPSQSVAIRHPPRIEHLDGAVISGGDCCEGSGVA